jgi:probable rRNA maturation factor
MKSILDENNLSVTSSIKGTLPRVPFIAIRDAILGKKFDLSVSFVGTKKSKTLNYRFRNKNKATNILSFEHSKTSGELILHLDTIKKDAPKFNMTLPEFTVFLVIHGCLHLKGMEHGSTMDKYEKKYFEYITKKPLP